MPGEKPLRARRNLARRIPPPVVVCAEGLGAHPVATASADTRASVLTNEQTGLAGDDSGTSPLGRDRF